MADTPPAGPPSANVAQPKNSKSKLPLVVAALVVLIGLAGGGYFVMTKRAIAGGKKGAHSAAPALKPAAAGPVAMLNLDSFVVNLADPGHNSFLRLGITLGLDKAMPPSGGEGKDSPFIPQIRDTILSVLTTWQSSQLLATGGKTELKDQLLHALRKRIPNLGVTSVYFTDFLIQQ